MMLRDRMIHIPVCVNQISLYRISLRHSISFSLDCAVEIRWNFLYLVLALFGCYEQKINVYIRIKYNNNNKRKKKRGIEKIAWNQTNHRRNFSYLRAKPYDFLVLSKVLSYQPATITRPTNSHTSVSCRKLNFMEIITFDLFLAC